MIKKLLLNNKLIDEINLNLFNEYLYETQSEPFLKLRDVNDNESRQHDYYRTLALISTFISDSIIFDIGTGHGYSALSLSYNNTNNVYSFDVNRSRKLEIKNKKNINFIIGDALEHSKILEAKIIYLDTAHDGIFERKCIKFLEDNNWRGLLIMDDCFYSEYPELTKIYNEFEYKKFDITKYGHFSGTALIDFNNELELETE